MRTAVAVNLALILFAATARGNDRPAAELTAEEADEGWALLFDGRSASGWQIDGDYEIAGGTLILGGARKTRARLPVPVPRGFELRFEYRTEGKADAGVGWDCRGKAGGLIPGVALPILPPEKDWQESFLREYSDIRNPFDILDRPRLIKHKHGANGVFAPVESVWIEVPAGSKLYLRQVRMKQAEATPWGPMVLILLVAGGIITLILWRWKRGQHRKRTASSLCP